MKRKSAILFMLLTVSLIALGACGPALPAATATTLVTFAISMTPDIDTPSAPTLSNEAIALTAEAAGALVAASPTSTAPAGFTRIPEPGDLGWGTVFGMISDSVTGKPIEGATVRCEHYPFNSPLTSPSPCYGTSPTNQDGIYSFTPVFFRETDGITLLVTAPGYSPLRYENNLFTAPELHADLYLIPEPGQSSDAPFIMCTAPACTDGVLVCGNPAGCQGGCGTICQLNSPTP